MQFSKLARYIGLGIAVLAVFALFVFLYLATAPAIAAFLDPLLSLIAILTGAIFFWFWSHSLCMKAKGLLP